MSGRYGSTLDERPWDTFLASSSLWREVVVLDDVDSTNTELARRARLGARPGSVLTADYQTGGKGRAGRDWVSPSGAGIAVSVLLAPTAPRSKWGWIPLLAGVATCDAISMSTDVSAVLKWPNDVLAGSGYKKCAGILAEATPAGIVLGIGLNVHVSSDDLPRPDTTSLALETSQRLERRVLLESVLSQLEMCFTTWENNGGDPVASGLLASYTSRCHTLRRPVTVWLPDGTRLNGVATAVDNAGQLCVADSSGCTAVAAGDVHHVRLTKRSE